MAQGVLQNTVPGVPKFVQIVPAGHAVHPPSVGPAPDVTQTGEVTPDSGPTQRHASPTLQLLPGVQVSQMPAVQTALAQS